jgi:hypothetical protein
MALPHSYAKAVWESERALATWLPDRHIRPGDVISRDRKDSVLRVETTLRELIGTAEPETNAHQGAHRMVLQDGLDIDALAEPGAQNAAIRARLSREHSFALVAEQGRVDEYRRLADARARISELAAGGRWSPNWHLVTAVRSFDALSLLIAESNEVEAAVELQVGAVSGIDLVRAGGAISVTKGRAASWSLGPCTPLYEALCIRTRRFRPDEVAATYLKHGQSSAGDHATVVDTTRPADLGLIDEAP